MMDGVKYYYTPAKKRPYWWVDGENVGNQEDGDKVSFSAADFFRLFTRAFEISREQYEGRTINLVDGVRWAALIKRIERQAGE